MNRGLILMSTDFDLVKIYAHYSVDGGQKTRLPRPEITFSITNRRSRVNF